MVQVAGMFGMNLNSGLEDVDGYFWQVLIAIGVSAGGLIIVLYLMLCKMGVLA